ncbi:putative reverse transcriptase domain-containing protein [Tanacetum coccineum]
MPPRMKTQSVGRQTAAPRGGQGGNRGIGANGGDDEVLDFSTVIAQQLQDLLPTIIAQVGDLSSNIHGDVRNVNVGNGRYGCSYKDFMACDPKDYDEKGDPCEVAATEPTTIQSVVLKAGMLTDEAIKNGLNLIAARGVCFECSGTNQYKAACPRLNQAPGQGGNRPNQVLAIDGGQGRGNNGIELSSLGFTYEIKIASDQLVEINKVIRGCKLEIEGLTLDIDLIPFGHESFDVIVGMDWLSRHKAKIVFHEKVVRIPLPNCKILGVLGEKPEEKVRHLMSAKVEEQELIDIIVVRNFPKVVPDDLSGFTSVSRNLFCIDLIPVSSEHYGLAKITILKTNTSYPSRRYDVSVPELTKDHEGNKPTHRIQKKAIRRIEDIVCEDSGRY